ncbi:hypothetical protein DPMN_071320 [Dreissena polymorpha]|uniref:Uncharacterized protein n=1 Tax=Dreissena polymorpha TaxID=45954 RepID=A0A9D4BW55_DREPO|nr:hypothetical protein DPMN_071320 [Dreissena polymorpha]
MRPQCLQGCPGVCSNVFTGTHSRRAFCCFTRCTGFIPDVSGPDVRVKDTKSHKFWIPYDAD